MGCIMLRQQSEFVQFLQDYKGASFLTLHTVTEVKVNKTSRVDKKITFLSTFEGRTLLCESYIIGAMVGSSYENMVNNRLSKEGHANETFRAESLPWGEWLIPKLLIGYKGETYLRYYQQYSVASEYEWLWSNGKKVTEDELAQIQPFLPPSKVEGDRQGIEDVVHCRCVNLSNVKAASFAGRKFV